MVTFDAPAGPDVAAANPRRAFSVTAAASEAGEEPALLAGDRTWTWSQLADDTERVAERLRPLASNANDAAWRLRVAFDARADGATVARILAAFEVGACAVPLHPALPASQRDARVRRAAPCIDLDTGERVAAEPAEVRAWDPAPAEHGEDADRGALALLFTSGTASGTPRAVELSAAAFAASADASRARLGWRPDDRWLCCLPLAHVGGLSIVTRCLAARRPIVLASFDPATLPARLVDADVTLASFVPTMLHRMLAAAPAWRASGRLRAALVGGAAAPDDLWDEIERRGVPALATYGMTETCSQVATARPDTPRRLELLPGVRARVREGRIEVAGPMLCTRVDRRPDSRSAWSDDGYFRTGDRGSIEGAVLTVAGRADDLIVTGGENVDPAEVESVLATHPAVRRAAVFGLPDPEWGEVVAAALETSAEAEDTDIQSWLESRLATFQRPRRLFRVADWPLTPSGKLDRRALASRCVSGPGTEP